MKTYGSLKDERAHLTSNIQSVHNHKHFECNIKLWTSDVETNKLIIDVPLQFGRWLRFAGITKDWDVVPKLVLWLLLGQYWTVWRRNWKAKKENLKWYVLVVHDVTFYCEVKHKGIDYPNACMSHSQAKLINFTLFNIFLTL